MKILEESDTPLNAKEIISKADEKGLIKSKGKTPEATLRGMLSRDVNNCTKKSYFKREKGKYTLLN